VDTDTERREPWTLRRVGSVAGAVVVTLLAGYGFQQLWDEHLAGWLF
jgi:hypothetical protein